MIKKLGCEAKGWKKETLDNLIINEIKKLALEPDKVKSLYANSIPSDIGNADVINDRISEIDKQIDKLLDLYQLGNVDISKLSGRMDELNTEKEKLLTELSEMKAPTPMLGVDEANKIVHSFNEIVDTGDNDAMQMIVRTLINKIMLVGDDVEIYWNFCVNH